MIGEEKQYDKTWMAGARDGRGPVTKIFKRKPEEIQEIAPGHGGCIATDRITVDGRKVGYMYRDVPANAMDSGWRFTAGTESQEYMDDPDHHAVYDINTIANYDPDIVPFLNDPVGVAYERDGEGEFIPSLPSESEG